MGSKDLYEERSQKNELFKLWFLILMHGKIETIKLELEN